MFGLLVKHGDVTWQPNRLSDHGAAACAESIQRSHASIQRNDLDVFVWLQESSDGTDSVACFNMVSHIVSRCLSLFNLTWSQNGNLLTYRLAGNLRSPAAAVPIAAPGWNVPWRRMGVAKRPPRRPVRRFLRRAARQVQRLSKWSPV